MTSLHARLIYQGALMLRGEMGVASHLRQLRGVEFESPEVIIDRQRKKLASVLTTASTAPFYRDHWGSQERFEEGDALERIRTLPLLDKSQIRRRGSEMLLSLTNRTTTKRSGGSTGEPIQIVKGADGLAVERAVSWLGYGWFGVQPGSKAARFWGTPLTRRARWKSALADIAMRRIKLSAFSLDPQDLDAYFRRCLRFRPEWFYGYTSMLDLFAQHLEDTGADGSRLALRSVVCTAEPLDRAQEERIQRVFQAPVQNEYGCGETGAIAYSCERGKLHVMTESVLVETLKDDGSPASAGESGEVVVTDLNNLAMPMVRYRLGDYAVLGSSECACQRGWPTLERVWGREYDAVYTPSGRRWHGTKVKYLMVNLHDTLGGFDQFQIVQVSPDTLVIRLVTNEEISAALRERVATYVADQLDGMKAEIRRVDAVERSPSGKLRVVRNDWLSASQQQDPT